MLDTFITFLGIMLAIGACSIIILNKIDQAKREVLKQIKEKGA